jgi:hypothetical protein
MQSLALQTGLSLPERVLLGGAAGLLATLVMDTVMRRLPEGTTPPYIAAATLTETQVSSVPHRLALTVHYGAGTASGLLLVVLALVVETVAGLGPLASFVVAGVVQLPVTVAFFSYVVVPTYGHVPGDRVPRLRRDWALSATVYVITVTVLVALPVLIA